VGDQFWLYISKERHQGERKKLNKIRYDPFKILKKIGNNAFGLDLPPYMQNLLCCECGKLESV